MSVGTIAPPPGGIGAPTASPGTFGQTPPSATPHASPTAASAAPAATVDSALTAVVLDAISAQDSLAPLLADLSAALEGDALPAAAQATAQRILAAQSPLSADVTGQDLRAAVAGSGLFLETTLAASALTPGGGDPGQAVAGDLKALLAQLVEALSPQALSAALELAAAEVGPPPEPAKRVQALARGGGARPPPPSRDALTSAQPAARPTVSALDDPTSLGEALRRDALGALARLQLSQIASLPKPGAATRWSFELPVAAPEGRAMAQFEISRDGSSPGAGVIPGAAPTWRARFSINVEPNGPVHAEVALSGGRTRVTLWGERDTARRALAAGQAQLAAELAGPEGADAAVRVLAGGPAPPAVEAGRLINRTS